MEVGLRIGAHGSRRLGSAQYQCGLGVRRGIGLGGGINVGAVTGLTPVVVAPGIHKAILGQGQCVLAAHSDCLGIGQHQGAVSQGLLVIDPGSGRIQYHLYREGVIHSGAVTQLRLVVLAPVPNGTIGPDQGRMGVTGRHLSHRGG